MTNASRRIGRSLNSSADLYGVATPPNRSASSFCEQQAETTSYSSQIFRRTSTRFTIAPSRSPIWTRQFKNARGEFQDAYRGALAKQSGDISRWFQAQFGVAKERFGRYLEIHQRCQDEKIADERRRADINKTIRAAVAATGGKITAERAGLIRSQKERKELVKSLVDEIPGLAADSLHKDLQRQTKPGKTPQPSTWFSKEITPKAQEQLKGLDAQRQAAKERAKRVIELGTSNKETENFYGHSWSSVVETGVRLPLASTLG